MASLLWKGSQSKKLTSFSRITDQSTSTESSVSKKEKTGTESFRQIKDHYVTYVYLSISLKLKEYKTKRMPTVNTDKYIN